MSTKNCEKCGQITSYNGWPNRATWAVKLHIDNTEESQRHALRLAADAVAEGKVCEQVKEGVWKPDRAAVYLLADHLKEWIEGAIEGVFESTNKQGGFGYLLARDLIDDGIDWDRIAEAFIEDCVEIAVDEE